MQTLKIRSTKPQAEFLQMDKLFKGFIAGFGTGNLNIGLFWKILTPIVTFVVAYFYIDKTS